MKLLITLIIVLVTIASPVYCKTIITKENGVTVVKIVGEDTPEESQQQSLQDEEEREVDQERGYELDREIKELSHQMQLISDRLPKEPIDQARISVGEAISIIYEKQSLNEKYIDVTAKTDNEAKERYTKLSNWVKDTIQKYEQYLERRERRKS